MGGQDCDGSMLQQAPIGSLPIRSDGLPGQSPTDDDRQISSEDRRSVKLRVRPPPAGTHQCHRAISAGSGMMLTVKLTESSSIDPQDTGLESAVNPPCWGSETAVSLNLTIPSERISNNLPPVAPSPVCVPVRPLHGCHKQSRPTRPPVTVRRPRQRREVNATPKLKKCL